MKVTTLVVHWSGQFVHPVFSAIFVNRVDTLNLTFESAEEYRDGFMKLMSLSEKLTRQELEVPPESALLVYNVTVLREFTTEWSDPDESDISQN